MSQEKYVGHYVEILKNQLNETSLKNVSLQANLKTYEEIVLDLTNANKLLDEKNELARQEGMDTVGQELQQKINEIEDLKKQVAGARADEQRKKLDEIDALRGRVTDLQGKMSEGARAISELEKLKDQVSHLNTFRNQLVQAQADLSNKERTIQSLNETIITLNQNVNSLTNNNNDLTAKVENLSKIVENLSPKTEDSSIPTKRKTKKAQSLPVEAPIEESVQQEETKQLATLEDGGSF
jgi:chromosome segregation ATPase